MATEGNYAPTPGVGASFEEFAEAISLLARSQVHTLMPATVLTWQPPAGAPPARTPALVNCQIDFLYRREINVSADVGPTEAPIPRATGWQAVGPYPQLVSVPVLYPGTDGMRISGPILPGARGVVVFAERSIDSWINMGGPVDPAFDYQWHHLSDGFFIPGARAGIDAEDIDPTVHRIGSADGGAGMEITEGPAVSRLLTLSTLGPTLTLDAATEIKHGANAALGVARLTDETSADTTMSAWIIASQVVLSAAAAFFGVPPPIAPTDFGIITSASTKVKAE